MKKKSSKKSKPPVGVVPTTTIKRILNISDDRKTFTAIFTSGNPLSPFHVLDSLARSQVNIIDDMMWLKK